MEISHHMFMLLLVGGALLVGAEIFVPGGILGLLGALALIAAVLIGFRAFGPETGLLIAMGVTVLAGLSIAGWLRFFPRTRVGRKLTLAQDGKTFTMNTRAQGVREGAPGVALTDLRPAGIAKIGEQRMDVTAEGGWIAKNTPVVVLQARGNFVMVRARTAGDEQHAS